MKGSFSLKDDIGSNIHGMEKCCRLCCRFSVLHSYFVLTLPLLLYEYWVLFMAWHGRMILYNSTLKLIMQSAEPAS